MSIHHDILGVPEGASDDDIKKAYKKKARELHPDMGGSTEDMQRLNQARDTLLGGGEPAHPRVEAEKPEHMSRQFDDMFTAQPEGGWSENPDLSDAFKRIFVPGSPGYTGTKDYRDNPEWVQRLSRQDSSLKPHCLVCDKQLDESDLAKAITKETPTHTVYYHKRCAKGRQRRFF